MQVIKAYVEMLLWVYSFLKLALGKTKHFFGCEFLKKNKRMVDERALKINFY